MKQANPKQSFVQLERDILDYWQKNNIIKKCFVRRPGQKEFVFFDGPPFATGLPHYGHLVGSAIKDSIARYQTMKGKYVDRRFGWDTHGVPIEMLAENALNLNGPASIKQYGIDKFNEFCRANVLKFSQEWEVIINRFGRWANFKNDYKTMDVTFMESVWHVFASLHSRGFIYRGHKVMPYSSRLATVLSNFEAGQDYREVNEVSAYVEYKLKSHDLYLLIWTTTPWTLPGNKAIAVNPETEYAKVNYDGKTYIVASDTVEHVFNGKEYSVLETMYGHHLVECHYVPWYPQDKDEYKVLSADWVTTESGTGLVHLAPAFGVDDYETCKKNNVSFYDNTDENGNLSSMFEEIDGLHFSEASKPIIKLLKQDGFLFKTESVSHRYPYCYRSRTPLMYKAMSVYFLNVEKIKEELVKANKDVKWHPDFVGTARFANWLADAKDWAISRTRFWGTPIPIWESEDGDTIVVGSKKELEHYTNLSGITDLHSHIIDKLAFVKNGKLYKRTEGVFDCWFESGSMPYGQINYPFSKKEIKQADFIAEGIDQTRGWFYTMLVIGVALDKQVPYKNVVVNGTVLSKEGEKLSKSLQNYVPVENLLERVGADAVRMYLLGSHVTMAQDLKFNEEDVEKLHKTFFIPLESAHFFFTQYYKEFRGSEQLYCDESYSVLDRWILASVDQLTAHVSSAFDNYCFCDVVSLLIRFVDKLNNRYIRNSRERFWREELNEDKRAAIKTLRIVLTKLAKSLAPIAPFYAEYLFQNVCPQGSRLLSVHNTLLEDTWYEQDLLDTFELAFDVVDLGRNVRTANKVPLKQPLSSVTLFSRYAAKLDQAAEFIKTELNVKCFVVLDEPTELAELQYKARFREIGKVYGKNTTVKAAEINALKWGDILPSWATPDMYDIYFNHNPANTVSNSNTVIKLDLTLNDELNREGFINTFLGFVQKTRKELGMELSDHCKVFYKEDVFSEKEIKQFEYAFTGKMIRDNSMKEYQTLSWHSFKITFKVEKS